MHTDLILSPSVSNWSGLEPSFINFILAAKRSSQLQTFNYFCNISATHSSTTYTSKWSRKRVLHEKQREERPTSEYWVHKCHNLETLLGYKRRENRSKYKKVNHDTVRPNVPPNPKLVRKKKELGIVCHLVLQIKSTSLMGIESNKNARTMCVKD